MIHETQPTGRQATRPLVTALRSHRAFDRVYLGVGAVLLIAAAVTSYEFVMGDGEAQLLGFQWLLVLLIGFEAALGTCLLAGLYTRQSRYVAIVTFGAFAVYSLSRAIEGHPSVKVVGKNRQALSTSSPVIALGRIHSYEWQSSISLSNAGTENVQIISITPSCDCVQATVGNSHLALK